MRNLSCFFLVFLLPFVAFGQQEFKHSVFFDLDKSELRSDALSTLEALVNQALLLPDFDLSIVAYTDDQGTEEYNRLLAQNRADIVQNYLSAHQCVPKTVSLKAIGKLSTNTKDKDKIEYARQQNRRVDIILFPNKFDNFRELDAKFTEKVVQFFKINANESILLTAKGGTKIFIPSGSLILPDGSIPKGEINVEINEAFTKKDWIANNLGTTTHEGEILETGGMFLIKAKAGKQDLKVKKGASLNVSMPALGGVIEPEMQLFTGTNKPGQTVTWQANIPVQEGNRNALITFGQQGKWQEQKRLDSLVRGMLKEAFCPATFPIFPKFDLKKLALSNRKPLSVPKYKILKEPNLPDCWEKPKELLTQKEINRNNKYKNSLKHYHFEKKIYNERWAKYKKDSADIAAAQIYRQTCRENWLLIEDSLFEATLIKVWNQHLQPSNGMLVSLSYLKYAAFSQNLVIQNIYNEFIEGRNNFTGLRNYYRRHLGLNFVTKLQTLQKSGDSKRQIISFRRINSIYSKSLNPWHKEQFANHYSILGKNKLSILQSQCKLIQQFDSLSNALLSKNIDVLQEYAFSITNLGWINCDRFLKYDAEDLAPFHARGSSDTRIFLICTEFKSALSMEYKNGYFLTEKIPKNTKIKLVAIKLEKGSPSLCVQSLVTGKRNIAPELVYKTMTLIQLEKELAQL
jgi:OmpA family